MYRNMLEKMEEAVHRSGDGELEALVQEIQDKVRKEHVPKVLFVSDLYGRDAVIAAMEAVCGSLGIPEGYTSGNDMPFCMELGWGEEQCTATDDALGEFAYTKIKLQKKDECLKGLDMVFWCGSELKALDGNVITDCDLLILFTNATMALVQREKEWLKNTVEPFFGGDRVIVALYRTEFLNTESDRTELCKSIEDTLGSIHKEIKFFADGQGLPAEIRQMEPLSDESRRKRQKAILKYGLSLMGKKINRQLELGSIDMEKLKDNVKRVEKERKDVELAGKIMVENTVGAFYTDLKNQIYDAAEQYNEDAYNSIRERISSTKDVKGDAEKIPVYLETVWTNFGSNVKEKLAQEQAKIVARLEERMEEDCGKLVGMLELSGDAPELSVLTVGKTYMRFGDGGNEADTKSKMVSKGMLIASISLAFVNPVWGLSAFAGTQLYQKYKERDAEQLRSQILGSLYGDCNEVRQKAVKQIYSVIDVAKKESGDNVGKIYSEIMDSLMDSIYQMVGKLEEAKKRCGILQELALEKLPAMEAQLNG